MVVVLLVLIDRMLGTAWLDEIEEAVDATNEPSAIEFGVEDVDEGVLEEIEKISDVVSEMTSVVTSDGVDDSEVPVLEDSPSELVVNDSASRLVAETVVDCVGETVVISAEVVTV